MKLFVRIGAATTLALVFLGVPGAGSGWRSAQATMGIGGIISLGSASGATVPVNTTAATDPYAGFNLRVRSVASRGVTLTGISGSAIGSTLLSSGDPNSVSCQSAVLVPGDLVFGCVALSGQSTAAAGLLARLTVAASGDGCVLLRLIGVGAIDPDIALYTYTINAPVGPDMQADTVDVAVINVLVGAGTLADCASATSVGGIAEQSRLPETPPEKPTAARHSRTRPGAVAIVFAAAGAAAVSGWFARRRRPR